MQKYKRKESVMKAKGFISEFRDFISRGNVMHMAVGVLIGGAFSSIVTSLTEDVISPVLGLFGGMNFDQLSINILGEVTLNYGKFITAVVNFLLMAFIIFLMLKGQNNPIMKLPVCTGCFTKSCPACRQFYYAIYLSVSCLY